MLVSMIEDTEVPFGVRTKIAQDLLDRAGLVAAQDPQACPDDGGPDPAVLRGGLRRPEQLGVPPAARSDASDRELRNQRLDHHDVEPEEIFEAEIVEPEGEPAQDTPPRITEIKAGAFDRKAWKGPWGVPAGGHSIPSLHAAVCREASRRVKRTRWEGRGRCRGSVPWESVGLEGDARTRCRPTNGAPLPWRAQARPDRQMPGPSMRLNRLGTAKELLVGIVRTVEWRLNCTVDEGDQLVRTAFVKLGMRPEGAPGHIAGRAKASMLKNHWGADVAIDLTPQRSGSIAVCKVDMPGNKHFAVLADVAEALGDDAFDDRGAGPAVERLGKSSRLFGREEIRHLRNILNASESVLELGQGQYEGKQGLVVLTDERMFFFEKSLGSETVEEFPLTVISSLSVGKKVTGETLKIYASGNNAEIKWMGPADRLTR